MVWKVCWTRTRRDDLPCICPVSLPLPCLYQTPCLPLMLATALHCTYSIHASRHRFVIPRVPCGVLILCYCTMAGEMWPRANDEERCAIHGDVRSNSTVPDVGTYDVCTVPTSFPHDEMTGMAADGKKETKRQKAGSYRT